MPSLKIRLLLLRDDNYTRSTIDYDCTVDCFVASGAHTYTFAPALVTAISIFFFPSLTLLHFYFLTFLHYLQGVHTGAIFFLRLNFAQPLSGIERGRLNISCHSSSLIASSMYIFFSLSLYFGSMLLPTICTTPNYFHSINFPCTAMCDGASEPIF